MMKFIHLLLCLSFICILCLEDAFLHQRPLVQCLLVQHPLDIELEMFYHSIPASCDDTDAFEYTWLIEDYVHNILSFTVVPP